MATILENRLKLDKLLASALAVRADLENQILNNNRMMTEMLNMNGWEAPKDLPGYCQIVDVVDASTNTIVKGVMFRHKGNGPNIWSVRDATKDQDAHWLNEVHIMCWRPAL